MTKGIPVFIMAYSSSKRKQEQQVVLILRPYLLLPRSVHPAPAAEVSQGQ